MTYEHLLKINKPFFSQDEVAYALGIKPASAAVLCSRYVKKGLLIRLKRGLYTRAETFGHLGQVDLFRIANILQVPSYISLMTALSYYGITTQVQRGFFESISIRRTVNFEAKGISFRYVKIRPDLYGGFERKEGIFIALPEKAILDCFYFASMGRYSPDIPSLDLTRMDRGVLEKLSAMYPLKTIKLIQNL
jgi:predicted transcriptional regulator of viral defense system